MKKIIISIVLMLLSLLCLSSCGSSDLEFEDENFKRIVATALDIDPDKLTKEDLTGIEEVIVYKGVHTDRETMVRTRECSISICLNGFREVQRKHLDDTTGTAEDPENYIYREKTDDFTGYADIANFKALKSVYIANDFAYEDINPLKHLVSISTLKQIIINNYNVYDISPMSAMTNLEELSLGGNTDDVTQPIKSLDPLKRLKSLKSLSFLNMRLPDVSNIGELENLESLALAQCAVKDISSFSKLKKLTYLNLNNNSIENIEPISNLPNLETVFLDYNRIEDVSSLANLNAEKLEYLSLDMNPIDDESPLIHLGNKVYLGYTASWQY